jgi:hypothetical protein
VKIAVLGSGHVGRTLGDRWVAAGHEVRYGSREPSGESVLSTAEAAAWGEVIVLAVPYPAVGAVVKAAGDLVGKTVIDVTNPIAADFSGLTVGHTSSAGEEIAALVPTAHVVKAFNSVGFNIMEDPSFPDGAASMLIAGNDDAAKAVVATLARDIGFDSVDAGPIEQSRLLEAMAWLWITMAMKYGRGREIAFRLMSR